MSAPHIPDIRRRIAAGDTAGALAACRAAVAERPRDAQAWQLLASAALAQGSVDEAAAALEHATALGPLPPSSLGDAAAIRLRRGDLPAAEELLLQALALDPDDAVLWRRRALVAERRKDAATAGAAYAQALRLAPDDAALHNNHGIFLRHQGRHAAAAAALTQAIALDPRRIEFRINLAVTLRLDGRIDDAQRIYREAMAIAPAREDIHVALVAMLRDAGRPAAALEAAEAAAAALPDAYFVRVALAATLLDVGRAEESLAAADVARALVPERADAWLHRGNALRQLDRIAAAAEAYREALARAPDDVQAIANLGLVLVESGDSDEGRRLADRAIALAPTNPDALHVAGAAAEVSGDRRAAERHLSEAIRIRPGFAEAQFSLGWLQLAEGRFAEGQRGFDRRWQLRRFGAWQRPFAQPLWDGRPIAGRRLLVWGDHGPGDQIMYGRLLPLLVARTGAAVTLECDPRLVPLFARALPQATVVPRSDPPHPAALAADLQCPTGSLLGRLCAGPDDMPRDPPGHLAADPELTATLRRRYDDGRLLVGISWHSRHPTIGDAKSLALEDWLPILRTPGCRFVDIQYGDHAEAREQLAAATGVELVHDPQVDPLTDYAAAAAQIAALDLVISISNTAAHLSGALATPTWTLLSKGRGLFWYWLRDRDDSPWYPTMRLFRQRTENDWRPVIAETAEALARRAAR
ncbi:MAG: tetratricopeptide repeat protein [Alphaproteobacteria bacterium]